MQQELPYGEAWLLEAMVTGYLPVTGLLYDRENMRNWLMMGHHDLSRTELRETLLRMIAAGDVVAMEPDSDETFIPSVERVDAALNDSRLHELSLGASAQAFAKWERLAQPDWSRYYEQTVNHELEAAPPTDGPPAYGLIAASPERLAELVAAQNAVCDLEPKIIRRWETQYLYKTLPQGYYVRIKHRCDPHHPRKFSPEEIARDQAIWHWATSLTGRKYL